MLSIQDAGLSILGDSPKNFYILGGSEYGIKAKYIDILVSKIGKKLEYDNVLDVVNLMSKFHLIPLQPQVYVVRYDKSFIGAVNKDLAAKILSLNIVGTLILIYEDTKDVTKLDKLFPENTVTIDPVDIKHLTKYLRSDFPDLDKKTIEYVAKHSVNYYQAQNICTGLNAVKDKVLLTEQQIISLFDIQTNYSNDDVQLTIATRDFKSFSYIIEHYDGDIQNILYLILRTMIELDKCVDGKYVNSPLKKHAKNWTKPDIYYMYNHTYAAIKTLRSGVTVDVADLLIYLGALMRFKEIPSTGVL